MHTYTVDYPARPMDKDEIKKMRDKLVAKCKAGKPIDDNISEEIIYQIL